MQDVTIGLAFIAGLLSFISPCVLPLVPAYVGYMGGRATRNVSMELDAGKHRAGDPGVVAARANMLLHGIFFVLGFTVVFVSIGLMITAFASVVGGAVSVFTTIIGRVGGVIIIIFGLHFMGVLRRLFAGLKARPHLLSTPITTIVVAVLTTLVIIWAFVVPLLGLVMVILFLLWLVIGGGFTSPHTFWPNTISAIEVALYSDTRPDIEQDKVGGLLGSAFMGVVFSAGWTPCIGPIYGAILTITANNGDVGFAIPMLTAYSLGLGIPFLLTAGLLEAAQKLLRKLQRHMGKIEIMSGTLLIVIGVLVATGRLQNISQNLSATSDFSVRLEECGVSFARGHLSFGQTRACLGGDLELLDLESSAGGLLSADAPTADYVIFIREAVVVDVELSNLDAEFPVIAVIHDADGNEVARSERLMAIDERKYVTLYGLELERGRYTLSIGQQGSDNVSFRVRVRETDPDQMPEELEIGPPVGLEVGNRAPDFHVTTIDAQDVVLSELRGQVVLVNFWGTWCGPCRREMPELQQVFVAHQNEGFTIVALASRDTHEAVVAFREDFELTFPLVVDEGNRVTEMYGIVSQPTSFVIGPDGVILHRQFGILLASQLEEVLATALEG